MLFLYGIVFVKYEKYLKWRQAIRKFDADMKGRHGSTVDSIMDDIYILYLQTLYTIY